jgi:hypothetical protein
MLHRLLNFEQRPMVSCNAALLHAMLDTLFLRPTGLLTSSVAVQ